MFSTLFLFGANIEISATKFEAYEKDGFSKFEGNVHIQKESDSIKSDILHVYFTKKKKATKYLASGNVLFSIIHENFNYNGSANKMIYLPKDKEYQLIGNAKIEEKKTNKKIIGETIIFNETTGNIKVLGNENNKPVKFIFEIEDK
jgi:lipopolysaccharide transport protein LptA